MEIVKALEKIVGSDRISTSEAVCLTYSYSPFLGKEWVRKPDIVVLAETAEQVSGILQVANRYKTPVTPKGAVGWTGHGGPMQGGIQLDLTFMDKIISIDTENMKAVAEAGCSFFKLSQELFKQGMMLPTAEYGPGPSVAASALTPVNAFGKTRYGRNIDLVEGFEVVLPDGEIIRVGSMAYADRPFGPFYRYITGPDLVGLFTQSNGAFGIVTKVAYRCLYLPEHWAFPAYYWPLEKIEEVTRVLMKATALEIFDVHINDKWKYTLFGMDEKEVSFLPEDCYFTVLFSINAGTDQELLSQEQAVEELCRAHEGTFLPGIAETFFTEWPTFFTPICRPRPALPPGVVMPGNYMYIYDSLNYPLSAFPEVYGKLMDLGKKYEIWGYPRRTVFDGFPMKSQVMCSQTWAFINSRDPHWVERIYQCRDEFRTWFGEKGGTFQTQFPPLVPSYVWTNQSGAFHLLKSIKKLLDPNDILSPGTFI